MYQHRFNYDSLKFYVSLNVNKFILLIFLCLLRDGKTSAVKATYILYLFILVIFCCSHSSTVRTRQYLVNYKENIETSLQMNYLILA